MKNRHSKAIRKQGDNLAFDEGQWEFQSRQFTYSANYLLNQHMEMIEREEYEGVAFLPTAQFLVSLAIELIAKAYYLKLGKGPREAIYKHDVTSLCNGIQLDEKQKELLKLAERNVVWAGRYPTPKWTKEEFKQDYDVPCYVVDGKEHINVESMANSSSPKRVRELLEIYSHLRTAWKNAPNK